MKKKIRQKFNKYLTASVFLMLLSLILTALWVVPVLITQGKRIDSIEARLATEMETYSETLQEQFRLMERNTTQRITELESNFISMQREAEQKIVELQRNISASERELAELEERLREKEMLLDEALANAALFEAQHNTTMDRVSTLEWFYLELNSTTLALQDRVENLEAALANTTARVVATEDRVHVLESGIVSLNTTKSSRAMVDELREGVDILFAEKADRTELKMVSGNLTTLTETVENTRSRLSQVESTLTHTRQQLNATEERLTNTIATTLGLGHTLNVTINRTLSLEAGHQELSTELRLTGEELTSKTLALKNTTEKLEERLANTTSRTLALEIWLNSVEGDINTLNTTKASKDAVNEHVERLDRQKVDRREFEVLSINLTLLAEDTSQMDEEIQQELDELADSALNETHYHELHEAIARKASQIDLDALASSTVRTSTFQERVESIQNSILQLQLNVSFNFTSLDGRIQHIDTTLSTKADQHDLITLTNRVTNLEGSKVDKDTFQQLEYIVEGIQESKADKTDVNQLGGRVHNLEQNTATKSELRSLDTKLSQHSSTSDGVHNRLSTDISGNSGGIDSNSDRITTLESSSPGLSPSLLVSVSLTLVTIIWGSHLY